MNVIPALEMKGWRTSASDCTGNPIVVKYEFVSSETFGSVSDLLVEGTRGFVHSLKPQEVNLS